MKITEMVERDCCDETKRDMRPLRIPGRPKGILFCIHCGQRWERQSVCDGAGGTEHVLVPLDMLDSDWRD